MGLPFSRLPLLESAIRPYLDCLSIVISSDWRIDNSNYEELLLAMSADIRTRVVRGTPRNLHGGRPIEISAWLAQNGEPGALSVVMDDDLDQPWQLLPDRSVFVGLDSAEGFTELDGRVIEKVLALNQNDVKRLCRGVRQLGSPVEKMAFVDGLARLTEWRWPLAD